MLQATGLFKTYSRHADTVKVLQGADLEVAAGEFVSVVGASGSGKSTLLHVVGTLDRPDSGEVRLDGVRIDAARGRARDRLRNKTFGFIFQFYHLLPELSVVENVMVPAMISGPFWNWWGQKRDARRRAEALLDRLGLSERKTHRPRELSGGEMQRTAIARALLAKPRVLLADEPTGNLDAETGAEVVRALKAVNREEGVTIVMVTHNLEIVPLTDRAMRMTHGRVESVPIASPSAGPWHSPGRLPVPVPGPAE